jgi:hypothetical protein
MKLAKPEEEEKVAEDKSNIPGCTERTGNTKKVYQQV